MIDGVGCVDMLAAAVDTDDESAAAAAAAVWDRSVALPVLVAGVVALGHRDMLVLVVDMWRCWCLAWRSRRWRGPRPSALTSTTWTVC